MSLAAGRLIHERYEIIAVPGFDDKRTTLGSGAFGITYLARDRSLDRLVAIKEYFPQGVATRDRRGVRPVSQQRRDEFVVGIEEFLEEARSVASVDHPNVVKVLDYFDGENGTAYMVMEYVRGPHLLEWLGDRKSAGARRLDETQVRQFLNPLLDALETLHERDPTLLHRDIKPNNIMLRQAEGGDPRLDQPVLIDFGAARQVLGTQTQNLTTYVSHGYAPYEQYTSQMDEEDEDASRRLQNLPQQGPWSDIYALAGVCYRALTGLRPVDALKRHLRPTLLRPLSTDKTVKATPKFLAAIERALAMEPHHRPQSVREWRTELADQGLSRESLALGLLGAGMTGAAGILLYLIAWASTDTAYRPGLLWGVPIAMGLIFLTSLLAWRVTPLPAGRAGAGRIVLHLVLAWAAAIVAGLGLTFLASTAGLNQMEPQVVMMDCAAIAAPVLQGAAAFLHLRILKRRTSTPEVFRRAAWIALGGVALVLGLLAITTLQQLSPTEQKDLNRRGGEQLRRIGYDGDDDVGVIRQYQHDRQKAETGNLAASDLQDIQREPDVAAWTVCATCSGRGQAQSIGEAMRRAVATATTINVATGRYDESITDADRRGIVFTFVGDANGRTTLIGHGDPVVTLLSGEKFEGFSIEQNGGGAAVQIVGSGVRVAKVSIVSGAGDGFVVRGSDAELTGLTIGSIGGVGVVFEGQSSGRVQNSTFNGTVGTSILVWESSRADAIGNMIINPGGSGIYYTGAATGSIDTNTVNGAKAHPAIATDGTSSPSITGNVITNSGSTLCMSILGSSAPSINNNKMRLCNTASTELWITATARPTYVGSGQTTNPGNLRWDTQ